MKVSIIGIGVFVLVAALLIGVVHDANVSHLRTNQLDLYIPRAAARLVSRGTRGAYSFRIGSPVFTGRGMWSRRDGLYLAEYVNDIWREYVLSPEGVLYVNHGEGWHTDIPAQRREDLLAVIDFAHLTRMDKLKDSLAIDWTGANDRTQWDGIIDSGLGYDYYRITWEYHARQSLPMRTLKISGMVYAENMHHYAVEVGSDTLITWSLTLINNSGDRGSISLSFNPDADLSVFPVILGK